jgi:hypothetical protein
MASQHRQANSTAPSISCASLVRTSSSSGHVP